MSRKNFQIKEEGTGRKYWISRSVAIMAMVIVDDEPNGPKETFETLQSTPMGVEMRSVPNPNYIHNKYVLINKRGEGCPDYVGCWNIPVGYLDFDETLQEACTRELMEEMGIYIDPHKWDFFMGLNTPEAKSPVDDTLKDNPNQNITVRFCTHITKNGLNMAIEEGKRRKVEYAGEDNEVSETEVMLINRENIDSHKWAFNHKFLLETELWPVTYVL